jgi:hypothetical protein
MPDPDKDRLNKNFQPLKKNDKIKAAFIKGVAP